MGEIATGATGTDKVGTELSRGTTGWACWPASAFFAAGSEGAATTGRQAELTRRLRPCQDHATARINATAAQLNNSRLDLFI
jgi:hypothetical protein